MTHLKTTLTVFKRTKDLEGVSGKTFKTEDSVVLEGDPPRLPGPSIFEYRDDIFLPPLNHHQNHANPPPMQLQEASGFNQQKFKRGNENGESNNNKDNNNRDQSPPENDPNRPQYFEMAGDELYVFEPSPMGVRPFMDSLFPERDHHLPPPREFHRQKPPRRNKFPKEQIIHGKQPHQHPHRFQLHGIKIEQVTPKDALGPSVSTVTRTISSSDSGISSSNSKNTNGICMSANEREGQCVPFKVCYPVVFNMINGELRNLGLARMLYQASGSCERNDTYHVQTMNVEVQPGVYGNVPFQMSQNFYNQTVCCPGYFYYEHKHHVNSIPQYNDYDFRRPYDDNGRKHNHQNKLKLKPSQLDPMLSPPEGRSQPYPSTPFPLPIFHEPLFDTDENNPTSNSHDYYVDEFDDYTTTTPTTTPKIPTSTSKGIPRKSQILKPARNNQTHFNRTSKNPKPRRNNTIPHRTKEGNSQTTTAKTATRAESSRSEMKLDVESTPINQNAVSSSSKAKSSYQKAVVDKPEKSRSYGAIVIPAPHLSAWNCPGRHISMPRGHWPWMVALLNEGSHFCTGSLIDHRHILTSATCVAYFQGKDIGRMRAILGDRVLYSSEDGPHLWRKILRITRHLQYNSETMDHDIAILEMDSAVTYTPSIQPINLPSSGNRDHTSKAIVSGWSGADLGKRFFSARSSVDAVVEFENFEQCSKKYEGFLNVRNVICTKPSNSTCKADLGAPLMMKTGNCFHIIGIFSNGLGCGNFPDMFTDVAKHIPWIQKNIRQHFGIDVNFKKP